MEASPPNPLPPLPLEGLLPQISKIPSDKWCLYQRDLERLHSSGAFLAMTLQKRLRKIARVCLVPEEGEALLEGDAARLQAVVILVAVLAEATGPEDEELTEAARKEVNWWVWNK